MTVLTFGKHKGTDIFSVPSEYLEWGASKLEHPKWRQEFESELKRRNQQKKEKESFVKANIDSQEVWDLLLLQAEKELYEEEDFSIENDCQYDGRIITQKEIEKLAKEKLAEYKSEVAIENLKREYEGREGLNFALLNKIEDVHYSHGLERSQFSSSERYQVACEYIRKLTELRGW